MQKSPIVRFEITVSIQFRVAAMDGRHRSQKEKDRTRNTVRRVEVVVTVVVSVSISSGHGVTGYALANDRTLLILKGEYKGYCVVFQIMLQLVVCIL